MSALKPPKLAVILAAGMGSRLGERGKMRPKGFLQLGDRPIIEESLERLRDAGIEHVLIVTGHCANWYEELAEHSAGFVSTVHNAQYANSGSMYSLYCARERINGDFLLLESDLIYERRALTELLNYPRDNAILLSGATNSGDEVFVETSGEQLVSMSKQRDELRCVAGELVGVTKISLPLYEIMVKLSAAAFGSSLRYDYETDALVQAASQYPVFCHLVPDVAWAEIDDDRHWRRAADHVYPAILRCDGALPAG